MTFRWAKEYKLELFTSLLCFLMLFYISGIPNTLFFSDAPKTYSYGPVSGDNPEQLFIILHNANGNGPSIMEIGLYYAPHFPDAVFIAPEGPKPSLHLPYDHGWFYRWFDTSEEVGKKAGEAMPYVRKHIEKAMDYHNVPPERTVLVGFSQGAVMALYTALRMDKDFAAIISFSGYIAGAGIPDNPALKNTSVLLLHGAKDDIIPTGDFYKALQTLQDHGYKATGKLFRNDGHQISSQMLYSSLRFLEQVLKEKEEKAQ